MTMITAIMMVIVKKRNQTHSDCEKMLTDIRHPPLTMEKSDFQERKARGTNRIYNSHEGA